MASAVGHFVMGATIAFPLTAAPSVRKVVRPIGLVVSAGLLSAAPDLDTAFFGVIPYAHFFGHRGFFHSPFFGILVAVTLSILLLAVSRSCSINASVGVTSAFALALASHGILDAMTDAGLGVMLLYPFSEERFFLPWRPFHAPPVKISSISIRQVQMMVRSELSIVLACAAIAVTVRFVQKRISAMGKKERTYNQKEGYQR